MADIEVGDETAGGDYEEDWEPCDHDCFDAGCDENFAEGDYYCHHQHPCRLARSHGEGRRGEPDLGHPRGPVLRATSRLPRARQGLVLRQVRWHLREDCQCWDRALAVARAYLGTKGEEQQ